MPLIVCQFDNKKGCIRYPLNATAKSAVFLVVLLVLQNKIEMRIF